MKSNSQQSTVQNEKRNDISRVDTELFIAARDEDLKYMVKLLHFGKRSAYVDCLNRFDQTPVMWAGMSGKLKSIKLLMIFNSDLEVKDRSGLSVFDHLKLNGYGKYIEEINEFKNKLDESKVKLDEIINSQYGQSIKIKAIIDLLK